MKNFLLRLFSLPDIKFFVDYWYVWLIFLILLIAIDKFLSSGKRKNKFNS